MTGLVYFFTLQFQNSIINDRQESIFTAIEDCPSQQLKMEASFFLKPSLNAKDVCLYVLMLERLTFLGVYHVSDKFDDKITDILQLSSISSCMVALKAPKRKYFPFSTI